MAKKRFYETMYIVKTDIGQEKREELINKVKGWITDKVGGEIETFERWGVRKLAYRTQTGLTDGDYTYAIYKADPDKVNQLEALFQVNPDVFRHQTFRREDLEKKEKNKKTNITVEEPVVAETNTAE